MPEVHTATALSSIAGAVTFPTWSVDVGRLHRDPRFLPFIIPSITEILDDEAIEHARANKTTRQKILASFRRKYVEPAFRVLDEETFSATPRY